jgi:hypothetical protein
MTTHAEQAAEFLETALGQKYADDAQRDQAKSLALVSIAQSLEKLVGAMVRDNGQRHVFVHTPNHRG